MADDPRPQLPEKPAPDECCGAGCTPCVLETFEEAQDEYHERLVEWYGRNPPAPQPLDNTPGRTRLVLDTNVSLDLFVFRDPRCAALLKLLIEGDCEVVTDINCRQEYLRVLTYPQLNLSVPGRVYAIEGFDTLYRFAAPAELPESEAAMLPDCADRDDQKFLQLALQTHADVLLSRDNALLDLAARVERAGLFTIAAPQAWLALQAAQ